MAKEKDFVKVDVPPRLQLDPFFKEILSLDAEKLFDFNLEALKKIGYEDIKSFWHPEEGYIFARGTLPVCLCAHMDKVPWYHKLRKISKKAIVSKNGKRVVDVFISSKQGIGGDDRCGVYAILSMIKLGHRPSVLFCMGEEIGCRGSRRFTKDFDKDFLDDINAFIQIDRRGVNDCVRYSASNDKLTKAMEQFGYKFAFGSCTDISQLMPHFGISGVNLSSGYYHEHRANQEFVSLHDVRTLLKRLDKILHSDIFKERYVYESSYTHYNNQGDLFKHYFGSDNDKTSRSSSYQLSLFDNYKFDSEDDNCFCDYCGQAVSSEDIVETDDVLAPMVCHDCASELKKMGFVECSSCGKLYRPHEEKYCPFCGTLNDEEL